MAIATKNRTVATLLTTSTQHIYDAPPSFKANIDSILVSNSSASPVTVTIEWWNKTESAFTTIMGSTVIRANGIVQLTDCMSVDQSDYIRAVCSANSAVTITLRATESYATSTL